MLCVLVGGEGWADWSDTGRWVAAGGLWGGESSGGREGLPGQSSVLHLTMLLSILDGSKQKYY